jgi:hypothetical protein
MTEHEKREDIRAEYDAEFESDEGHALAKVEASEVLELLGPSQRERGNKVVLAFRKRIKEAEREVLEMQEREVAYQTANRVATDHSAQLAAERDHWRDLKDPQQLVRSLSERLAQAEAKLAGYEKAEEAARAHDKQQAEAIMSRVAGAMQARRLTWWERLLNWWTS